MRYFRKLFLGILLFLSAFSFGNFVRAQNLELPSDAQLSIKQMPYADMIEFDASRSISIKREQLRGRDAFLTIPIRYKRTAELKQDLKMPFDLIAIKAGAQGYWAGHFGLDHSSGQRYGMRLPTYDNYSSEADVWCFFGENSFRKNHYVCVQNQEVDTLNIYVSARPYLLTKFVSMGSPIIMTSLVIEEKPLTIFDDLELEYRFERWKPNSITINTFVKEAFVDSVEFPLEADGSALVRTPVGLVRFNKVGRGASFEIVD